MLKFLRQGGIFLFFLILLFLCLNYIVFNSRKNIISLPGNITTVFLGHSTIEVALNDSLYPNSFNFAHSGEALRIMYAKLKLIHKYNPQIDTIFLVFDDINIWNTNLTTAHNNLNFADQFTIDDRITDLHHNLFLESFSHLYDIKKIGPNFISYLKPQNIQSLKIGGFVKSSRNKLDVDIERFNKSKNPYDKKFNIPDLNLYYFNRIITYCKDNHIKLIFLSPPKYPLIWDKDRYRKIHADFFNEIPLVDCMEWTYPDSCYGDMVHLNHRGAELFSRELNNLIKNNKTIEDSIK